MNESNTINLSTRTDLDQAFWEAYARLWQNSKGRSPFQAPQILQCFAGRADNVTAFEATRKGELIGAALFKKNNGAYSFLSDLKTDANFFVLHERCDRSDTRQFFELFLKMVKKGNGAFMLNNQPGWAEYMDTFEAAGKAAGLYWMNIPYSVCPTAEAETPEALRDRVNGMRDFRYAAGRLKKQEQAEYEAIADGTELEPWAEAFCQAHVKRWDGTPTPSAYRDPARRQFLKDCLEAWNNDGILVRFSVKVPAGRVGFAIGLREQNSLVFHATTFHPDYKKFSPGIALIHFITGWMAEQGLKILDFGDGDEPYKYTVANKEHELRRIFISSPTNLPFILKTKAIKIIRHNPKMYNFYRDKIKRLTQRVQI